MLFTERSLLTMLHGIGFGGAALLALAAAIAVLYLLGSPGEQTPGSVYRHSRALGVLGTIVAATLWLTSFAGTFVVFPPYRATPPEGTADLTAYPRSLVLSNPETEWLHAFAMETKEHLPWVAVMLTTALAFVFWRSASSVVQDGRLRGVSMTLLVLSLVIVSYVSMLGIFVNKVAPLF